MTALDCTRRPGQQGSVTLWALIWLCGMLVLAFTLARQHVPARENQLAQYIDEQLHELSGHQVKVAVSGDVAHLMGPVPDARLADRAVQLALSVAGIRSVDNELTIGSDPATIVAQATQVDAEALPAPALAAMQPAAAEATQEQPAQERTEKTGAAPEAAAQGPAHGAGFSLTRSADNELALSGPISDQEPLLPLVRQAIEAFDPEVLDNRVEASADVAPAPWLAELVEFMPDLAELQSVHFEVIGSELTLGGVASTQEQHDRIIAQALVRFSQFSLVEQITVSEQAQRESTAADAALEQALATEPTDEGDPAGVAETADPNDEADPAGVAETADPNDEADPAGVAEAAAPNDEGDPAEVAEAADPTDEADPVEVAETAAPTDEADPAESSGSSDVTGESPGEAAASTRPADQVAIQSVPAASADAQAVAELQAALDEALSRPIRFNLGSDRLRPASQRVLNEVARVLLLSDPLPIKISGHTDAAGDESLNLALSQARANVVRDYLVSRGIAPGQVSSHGYGESFPLQGNNTATGRAANRRIEFEVLAQ